MQQGVCEAVRAAEESTQNLFAGASSTVDKRLGLVVRCATSKGMENRPDTSSLRTAIWNAYAEAPSSRARSGNITLSAPMPNSPEARDP